MGDIQPSARGSGPLLERDYWAVLREPRAGPTELATLLAGHFPAFAPPVLVRFSRTGGPGAQEALEVAPERPLEVGDELGVDITTAGSFAVRVIHRNANSLTLATLEGHPEAGRITFGLYPNRWGDVVFHIRSRARSRSRVQLAGFLFAGDPMQTNTWSDFINRFAASTADGVIGAIHAEKRTVDEEPGDRSMDGPTFVARGD